jgi:hypothetical protein
MIKTQNVLEYQIQYLNKNGCSPKQIRKHLKKIMPKTRIPSLKVVPELVLQSDLVC